MVERKAGLTSFGALKREVDRIRDETLKGHADQISLSLRFIDWFSVSFAYAFACLLACLLACLFLGECNAEGAIRD